MCIVIVLPGVIHTPSTHPHALSTSTWEIKFDLNDFRLFLKGQSLEETFYKPGKFFVSSFIKPLSVNPANRKNTVNKHSLLLFVKSFLSMRAVTHHATH